MGGKGSKILKKEKEERKVMQTSVTSFVVKSINLIKVCRSSKAERSRIIEKCKEHVHLESKRIRSLKSEWLESSFHLDRAEGSASVFPCLGITIYGHTERKVQDNPR